MTKKELPNQNPLILEEKYLPDSPEIFFYWPNSAQKEGNWPESAIRWALIRKAYPNHPAGYFNSAKAQIETGNLDSAQEILKLCKQKFPNHPSNPILSAVIAMKRKNMESAEKLLINAREKFPEHVPTWIKSAEYAELIQKYDLSSEYFQRASQLTPDKPAPYIQHAKMLMRTEQWRKALDQWKTVRELFPDLPIGYDQGAEAARKLKDNKEARDILLSREYGIRTTPNEDKETHTAKLKKKTNSNFHLSELIWTKAIFNLRSEVQRNYLSYGWWVIEPLMHMVVYYIVFGLLLNQGGDYFPLFLLTGLVPWMWFMKSVTMSSSSILAGQNLMLQVGIPSIFFPMVSLLQASIKQIPVFLLLFGFVWLQGSTPGPHWWALVPIIFVQALLTISVACCVAAIIPFVRDLTLLVPTGLVFLMFLSGIFYDYKNISSEWQDIFLLNPIAYLLKCYREVFIDSSYPEFTTLMWWGIGSGISCLVIIYIYTKLRYLFPRVVLE